MYQPPDAFFRGDPRDPRRAFMLDRVEVVLAAGIERADAVHNGVRARHGAANTGIVADIAEHRFDLADDAIGFHEHRLVRMPRSHPNPPSLARHPPRDIAPDKARTAIDRHEFRHRQTFIVRLSV